MTFRISVYNLSLVIDRSFREKQEIYVFPNLGVEDFVAFVL